MNEHKMPPDLHLKHNKSTTKRSVKTKLVFISTKWSFWQKFQVPAASWRFFKKMVLQDICHFSKALVSGIFFQVKRIWPEGVAFTKEKFYTAQTRTRWRFSFNVMKTWLFKFDNPNLEKVVYYFILFVLEMFFEESDTIALKITTKLIIRRQLSKFNQDFFLFHISFSRLFSLFHSFSFPLICTQNS